MGNKHVLGSEMCTLLLQYVSRLKTQFRTGKDESEKCLTPFLASQNFAAGVFGAVLSFLTPVSAIFDLHKRQI